MSNSAKKLLNRGLLTLPLIVLLSGCIGGGSGGSSATSDVADSQTVEVSGGAVKGVIQQGIVRAHRLVPNQHGVYVPDEAVSETVRTNAQGAFSLELNGSATGWALVELEADAQTTMKCDVMPACEVGADTVPFGASFRLAPGFTLRGAVDLSQGEVFLTPLSHLAVAMAGQGRNGYSAEALTQAYAEVEHLFGLVSGSLQIAPPDLTALSGTAEPSDNALQLAVVNAAFLAVVNDNSRWNSITDVLGEMVNQVTATGGLETTGSSGQLWLGSLIGTAALQSADLGAHYQASAKLTGKFAAVMEHNLDYADAIHYANAGSGQIDFTDRLPGSVDSGSGGIWVGDSGSSAGSGSGSSGEQDAGDGFDDGISGDITAGPNVALLSWTAPLTRENGDSIAMAEIKHFEIRYAQSQDELEAVEPVKADSTADQMLIDGLKPGTWYFQISTVDTADNHSQWSQSVSKTISG